MKHTINFKAMLRIAGIIALAVIVGFGMMSCPEPDDGGGDSKPSGTTKTKTVAVGSQKEIAREGVARDVTYDVTTANIANGPYTATVPDLPKGVSVKGQVTIANNKGVLTLACDTTTVITDKDDLTLTIDGATSAPFSLSIISATAPGVVIGNQGGSPLTAGTAGSATYVVTTENVPNGTEINFDNKGAVGVSLDDSTKLTTGDSTTIKINTTDATPAGLHDLSLTILGVTREFKLNVQQGSAGGKSILLVSQLVDQLEGRAGIITFRVETHEMDIGPRNVFVTPLPKGIDIGGNGQINFIAFGSGGLGTLILTSDTSTVQGDYNLTLTIDGVSKAFTLKIHSSSSKLVSVGRQDRDLKAGVNGNVTYELTTTNIGNDSYTVDVKGLPQGISVLGQVTISNNKGMLTLGGTTAEGGTHLLTLTIDGATSREFRLDVESSKTVSVGEQQGTLRAFTAGSVSYKLTTTGFVNGTYPVAVYNAPENVIVENGSVGVGFTNGQVAISGNEGTLTLTTTGALPVVKNNLLLNLDGAASLEFTLTILSAKYVFVEEQQGTVKAGAAGSATFQVTTVEIDSGSEITLNNPGNVTDIQLGSTKNTAGDITTVTINTSAETPAGLHSLTLTIDGVTSWPFILAVKSATVGEQVGSIRQGVQGSVSFPVTTVGIRNGSYAVTIAEPLPTGLSIGNAGNVNINGGNGTLFLTGTPSQSGKSLTLTIDGITTNQFTLDILPPKKVEVDTQAGNMYAGFAGTVTFPITTENIADGSYWPALTGLPSGVYSSGQVVISSNTGTLTLSGNTSQTGYSSLRLTIDGTPSDTFTLNVAPPPKSVSVDAQVGTMRVESGGNVSFNINTAYITNGNYTATLNGDLPNGVTVSSSTPLNNFSISNNRGTLRLTGTNAVTAGTADFTLTIDGVTSDTFTLTIVPPMFVNVGEQVGTLRAGSAGTVTFPVITGEINDGSYPATVVTLPTGVTVSGQVTIADNAGTLTLNGNTAMTAQTRALRLTINGQQSAEFTLTIRPARTVTVGGQGGLIRQGTGGTVSFPVTTVEIDDNASYTATLENAPSGVSVTGNVAIAGNSGTLTLNATAAAAAGTYSSLRITIDGVTSLPFALKIDPGKTVSVGAQSGELRTGTPGNATYTVTTGEIASGSTITLNYSASVAGIGLLTTATTGNSTTVSISTTADTIIGSHSLSLTIDGVTSNTFTLSVLDKLPKTATVETQSGEMRHGIASSVTFPVNTAEIAAGSYTVSVDNLPAGVTVGNEVQIIADGTGLLTLTGNASVPAGTHNTLVLNIDGVKSAAFTLEVLAPIKTVSVGTQNGALSAGVEGSSVTFPVTTAFIDNGNYTATLGNAPTGVSAGQVTINNNTGTLTLTGAANTVAGTTNTMTLTIDGTTSESFTLVITQPLIKSVTVGTQVNNMAAGMVSSVTFPVTASNISNGSHNVTVNSLPSEITASSQVTISNNSGTLTLTSAKDTTANTYNNLTLTIDGVTSDAFTLTIIPTPTFEYVIRGTGVNGESPYTATRGGVQVEGAVATGIQAVIDAIQTDANGTDCQIQFNTPTNITTGITFTGSWGLITLRGVLQGNVAGALINMSGAVSINANATISQNSLTGAAINNTSSGTLTVTGGNVRLWQSTAAGTVIFGPVTVTGGTISHAGQNGTIIRGNTIMSNGDITATATNNNVNGIFGNATITGGFVSVRNGNAIHQGSANISGGTVSATTGTAVNLTASTNILEISNTALVTTANVTANQGTILNNGGTITITGGTVRNTGNNANSRAIYNQAGGTLSINGGKVACESGANVAQNGIAVYNNGNVPITVGGGTVISAGTSIYNAGTGAVRVTSGRVESTAGVAIDSVGTGLVTVEGVSTVVTSGNTGAASGTINIASGTAATRLQVNSGTVSNTAANGNAVYNNSTGAVNVAGGTVSATTGRAIHNNTTAAVNVSGNGSVEAGNGTAIYNNTTGLITVSGGTVTSANASTTGGTIHLHLNSTSARRLNVTGGTVSNTSSTANTNAIYNDSNAMVSLGTNATVSSTANATGYAIHFTNIDAVLELTGDATITGRIRVPGASKLILTNTFNFYTAKDYVLWPADTAPGGNFIVVTGGTGVVTANMTSVRPRFTLTGRTLTVNGTNIVSN